MADDPAPVQYGEETTGDPGPVVDLESEEWEPYYGAEDEAEQPGWNDESATWVLDIGKDATNAAEARAAVAQEWEIFKEKVIANHFDDEVLLSNIEKVYSTSRAAEFFGRSTQWMYWGLRKDPKTGEYPFSYKDGSPIQPERVGSMGKRRFTLPIIREIALACYRRGNLSEEELEAIMARILLAEFGKKAFANAD
jgi:hypothetical protein